MPAELPAGWRSESGRMGSAAAWFMAVLSFRGAGAGAARPAAAGRLRARQTSLRDPVFAPPETTAPYLRSGRRLVARPVATRPARQPKTGPASRPSLVVTVVRCSWRVVEFRPADSVASAPAPRVCHRRGSANAPESRPATAPRLAVA